MKPLPEIAGELPADLDASIKWARANGKPILAGVLEDVKAGKVRPEDMQVEVTLRELRTGDVGEIEGLR